MKNLEKTFKALADQNRIRILKLLEQRAMCVCELVAILGISQSTVSKHLKKLTEACLIKPQQDGLWTNYTVCKECIYPQKLLNLLKSWLNDDPIIIKDLQEANTVNKQNACTHKK